MIREWMPQSLTGRQVPSADETKRETEGIVSVASANGKVTNYTVEKWQAEIKKKYGLARVIIGSAPCTAETLA